MATKIMQNVIWLCIQAFRWEKLIKKYWSFSLLRNIASKDDQTWEKSPANAKFAFWGKATLSCLRREL